MKNANLATINLIPSEDFDGFEFFGSNYDYEIEQGRIPAYPDKWTVDAESPYKESLRYICDTLTEAKAVIVRLENGEV